MNARRGARRQSIALVGAGRLARSLLQPLLQSRHDVRALYARRPGAARSALRRLGRSASAVRATASLRRALDGVSWVLIAVPDRTIHEVAAELAGSADWKGRVALHHAGSLGTEPLQPLADAGAAVGVLHPLQCLGDPDIAHRVLPGSAARIEGMPEAVRAALDLAEALKLVPLRLPETLNADQRAAYHAAAALVSNDVVGLLALAVPLLRRAGLPEEDCLGALLPLIHGTLAQLGSGGFRAALTGPAVRGDLDTLQRHLDQLAKTASHGPEIHRLLSTELVRRAQAEGLPLPTGLLRKIRRLD